MSRAYLDRAMAAGFPGSSSRLEEVASIAREIADRGIPTPDEMRERLRMAMADCPACAPEDADDVPDAELVGWLISHDVEPAVLP